MNKAVLLGAIAFYQWSCLGESAPMTIKEISMLLRNGEQSSYIQENVSLRKLAEPLTPEQEAALKALGASPALLQALKIAAIQSASGSTPPRQNAVAPAANAATPPVLRSLLTERRAFATRLVKDVKADIPVPTPPTDRIQIVNYHSQVGDLPALMTNPIMDGTLHPAIVWITGGWTNSIASFVWEPAPPQNDQTASAFASAGIITLYPSLRGGNRNPGSMENFYGEVDDVIAAAEFLSRQPGVDPNRIYLGGHSTGGTLALLVAECSDRFRSVFAFGAVSDITRYSGPNLIFDPTNPKEIELRSPINWLHCIRNPTFVFEGSPEGNVQDLNLMQSRTKNPMVHFFLVGGSTHFSILAPFTRILASKILADRGATPNISFSLGKVALP